MDDHHSFIDEGVAPLSTPAPHAPGALRRLRRQNTIIAAFSNLSTTYNLVNINLAHVIMENQYCNGDDCKSQVTTASTACLAGAIIGQLTFGYIGDCLGRGRALMLTMCLSILGALVSACAVPLNDDPTTVFVFLAVARFVLGIGVGGVYPLAATIAAESSSDAKRGKAVSIVFSMQGVGTLLVPLVGAALLSTFGTVPRRQDMGVRYIGIQWRFILGLGAVPGMILMPFQLRTQAKARELQGAQPAAPTSQLTLLEALKTRRYWPKLIGCAGGWFLFDITFYGNTLFSPTVLKDVFHETSESIPTWGPTLRDNLCWQQAILALIGLPGYYLAVCFMDRLGRKNIQLQGFVIMALLYGALGLFLPTMEDSSGLLLFVYGLTYFSSNFGPNSTTFILPSETFPQEVRSSLNGVSAAAGKAGATLGAALFKPLVNTYGAGVVFYLCAGVALLGAVVTVFFVEDRRGVGMASTSFTQESSSCQAADERRM